MIVPSLANQARRSGGDHSEPDAMFSYVGVVFRAGAGRSPRGGLTSDEHFTVDGTLVEAWAGLKSSKRKDGSDGQIPPATVDDKLVPGRVASTIT